MKSFIFLFLIISLKANALDLKQAYQEGGEVGKSHARHSLDLLKDLDLNNFPGYQRNLPQEHYYSGVTQEKSALEAESQNAVGESEAGNSITESFNHRPVYKVNTASESMQKLNQIAENAEAIIKGESTEKTRCTLKPRQCQYSWQEKKCLAAKELKTVPCAKTLHLKLVPFKTESYILVLKTRRMWPKPYKIFVDLNKRDTCTNRNDPCYTIDKNQIRTASNLADSCTKTKVSLTDPSGLVVLEETAGCADVTLTLSVGKCVNGRCNIPFIHSVIITIEQFESQDYWDDQCQPLKDKKQEGFCHLIKALSCIENNQTRIIDGVSFTRPCWKEQATYKCGVEAQNTCNEIIKEGCEQTDSTCFKEEESSCKVYQQTYQCPLNQCTENELLCGEGTFCLDGDCATTEYKPADEADFKKALSNLSAISEASKNFDGKANFIFKGEQLECSNLLTGIKNCCRDSGWGIDLNLVHCSDAEKKLGKARENKLVVPTGDYCFQRQELPVGSVCIEHHETFCVFQSKLARIVQVQGRWGQLHINFGMGEYSNCSGITPAQMQLIHFEDIDFSEFFDDLKNKIKEPDYKATAKGIGERLGEFYKQGDING